MLAKEPYSNSFLLTLNESSQYSSTLSPLGQKEVYLLLPRSGSVEEMQFDQEFVDTHLIFVDPDQPTHFVSANGMLGLLSSSLLAEPSPKSLLIISLPSQLRNSPPPSLFNAPLFGVEKDLRLEQDARSILIHEVGELPVQGRNSKVILIGAPVVYPGCSWLEAYKSRRRALLRSGVDELSLSEEKPGSGILRSQSMAVVSAPPVSGPKNPFLQRVNHPSAAGIVNSIQQFIRFIQTQSDDSLVEQDTDLVRDFLEETEEAINVHPLWRSLGEKEMQDTFEALEKFLLVNLHPRLFGNRVEESEKDMLINETLNRLEWIKLEHLEINPSIDSEVQSMGLAVAELKKMNKYKAPKDKLICVRNCSKVIYKMLEAAAGQGSTSGADDFLPVLIIVLIRANPANLQSNIQYIRRFRNPSKLLEEAGYYLTQLESAVHFLLNIKYSYLKNVTEEAYNSLINGKAPPASSNLIEPISAPTQTPPSPTASASPSLQGGSPNALEQIQSLLSEKDLGQYSFLHTEADNLTLADVRQLLSDYKILARQNELLRKVALTHRPLPQLSSRVGGHLDLARSDNHLSFTTEEQEQPEELSDPNLQVNRRMRARSTYLARGDSGALRGSE